MKLCRPKSKLISTNINIDDKCDKLLFSRSLEIVLNLHGYVLSNQDYSFAGF